MSSSHHLVRPAYPAAQSSSSSTVASSSTSSSAYQSSSSLPSLVMPSANPTLRQHAPLPSPTAQQPAFQFASMHPSSHQQYQQQQQQQQQPQYAQQALQQQQQQNHPFASGYQPNRGSAGRTAAETGQFLSNYSLVAEAARRAQMAVLARDLESMEM